MKKIILTLVLLASSTAVADDNRLRIAVEMDDVSTVQRMIDRGEITADQGVMVTPYGEGPTAILIVAARAGSEKVVQLLISKGANLNAKTVVDETALMLSVFFDDSFGGEGSGFDKHDRIARRLIDAGADVNNGSWNALAYAAYNDRTAIGKYLIQKGAHLDGPLKDGVSPVNTPLMMSAMRGHKNYLLMLLRAGAKASLKNSKGTSAIELAKKYNQTHLIGYLKCALALPPGGSYAENCDK